METEKVCLEEISHLVLDAGKNVTLPMLSHNHGLPFIKCSELLNQWLKNNKADAGKVTRSFFVRYKDESGSSVVSVMSYDKLKSLKVCGKNSNIEEMLYGILLTSTNRSMGLKENYENVHIPIKAKFQMRNIKQRPVPVAVEPKIHIKSEKVTAAGTKNISSMMGSSSSKDVKKEPVKEVKTEKKESPAKKPSPPKKESPKKANNKNVASGKGNIASFFAKAQAKQSKPKPEIKPEPVKTPEEPTTSNNHISVIDSDTEEIPNTPEAPTSRKNKKQNKIVPSKRHARIAVLEDSSESEDEEERDKKRNEKEIEVNVSDEEMKEPPKQEVKEVPTANKRRKGVRTVYRKYLDDNGFMVTRKETEEYEISEEEDSGPVEKKVKAEVVENTKPKTEKPAAKTKQKNIMSFFNRK